MKEEVFLPMNVAKISASELFLGTIDHPFGNLHEKNWGEFASKEELVSKSDKKRNILLRFVCRMGMVRTIMNNST